MIRQLLLRLRGLFWRRRARRDIANSKNLPGYAQRRSLWLRGRL